VGLPRAARAERRILRLGLGLLSVGLALSVMVGVSAGSVAIPLDDTAAAVLSRLTGRPTEVPSSTVVILWSVRLPRVLTAVLVGAGLATAGALFQGLLRNPLADPYVIGTSGGAAMGATLVLVVGPRIGLGYLPVPAFAFAGALLSVLVVYRVARVGARTPVISLLLAGFAMSAMLTAVMSFLMLMSEFDLRRVVSWTMGGLTTSTWDRLAVTALLVVLGLSLAMRFATELNAMAVGEEQALHLGVDIERSKLGILAVGSLLTAAAVSVSGLIGFVGLVVPHMLRLVVGPQHRVLLPLTALTGGSLLVLADAAARLVVAPREMPVGIVTALAGAPFFLFLLRTRRYD
jgi:iron complex transport system permease protein